MQRLLNPIYCRRSDCRIRDCVYFSKTIRSYRSYLMSVLSRQVFERVLFERVVVYAHRILISIPGDASRPSASITYNKARPGNNVAGRAKRIRLSHSLQPEAPAVTVY